MAKTKNTDVNEVEATATETPVEESTPVETPVQEVAVEATPVEESEAKKAFRVIIEKYKTQNPTKYELKKDEFEKKLNTL